MITKMIAVLEGALRRHKKYLPMHRCVEVDCLEELSDEEIYSSDGVCPRCGRVSLGTIVDTEKCARLNPYYKEVK